MSSERSQRIQLLFEEALTLPAETRSAFIDSACGAELELRDEVASLLADYERAVESEDLLTTRPALLRGPAPARFTAEDRVASRYLIHRLIGRGGMGEVYEAWDEELSIPVALKTLHLETGTHESLQRLKLEGFLARSVWHPNVCRVYDLGRHGQGTDTVWFLTMELLRGEALSKRLREQGRLPLDCARGFAQQMAAGLGAAHRAGVVHRDFKPSNVMLVTRDGSEEAVVADFGIARAATRRVAGGQEPESAAIIGTPAYMAPEQVRGEEVGPAADIYALGVVLYEMVTGTLPFAGGSAMEVAKRRLTDEPPSPRDLVPDLEDGWDAIILRCLAREPGRRFHRAQDLIDALAGRALVEAMETLELKGRGWIALPEERDAFVGREIATDELERNLSGSEPVVTLVGAGGMGKTRLAVRYGWQRLHAWPGGVWFCDLTEARDMSAIASAVGSSLGIELRGGDPIEKLGSAIAGRGRCLMILDNFEQVAEHAAETVGRWLERAPMARFLVTSRMKLNLGDREKVQKVQTVEPLSSEAGWELFAARARQLRPGLELIGLEAESAREIVKLVDGMPLAIELAAARMRVMSAAQVAAQMRNRFQLLTGGISAHHETLIGTIDGSWELLSPWEKAAWAQCSVFEGGFTLEAAEGVLELSGWQEVPPVVDIVQSLVDKSLLRTVVPGARPGEVISKVRFGMYVSLQEYARMKLEEGRALPSEGTSAKQAAEERHGRWYARYGSDEVLGAILQHGGLSRHRELELELENLLAACRRALAIGNRETAFETYRGAVQLLLDRGPLETMTKLGLEILASAPRPDHRGRILFLLGWAAIDSGHMVVAQERFEEALAISRQLGNRRREGHVSDALGGVHLRLGRNEEARVHYEHALAIARELGDRRRESFALLGLAMLHSQQGRLEEALHIFEESLVLCRSLGNRRIEAAVLGNLGTLHQRQGRAEAARECLETALTIHQEFSDRMSAGNDLNSLGCVYLGLGNLELAHTHFHAALKIHREMSGRVLEGLSLGNLGRVHFERGDLEEARAAHEEALAIFREIGNPFGEGEVLALLASVHLKQGRLDEARAALREGDAILRRVDGRYELANLLCERSELEHREGNMEAAHAALAEAEAIAARMGARSESELGRKLAKLRQTLAHE